MGKRKKRSNPFVDNLFFLCDISDSHDEVFIDTCAIHGYKPFAKGVISGPRDEIQSIGAVYSSIKKGGKFYVIPNVRREFLDKKFKNGCISSTWGQKRWAAREKLASLLKEEFLFHRGPFSYDNYTKCLEEARKSDYFKDLSETDFDILSSAYCSSMVGKKTALITTDFPIIKTWKRAMRGNYFENKGVNKGNFSMFLRRRKNGRCQKIGLNTPLNFP